MTDNSKQKFKEWNKCRRDACLIFKKNERILFHCDEKERDLRLKSGSRVFELMMLLKGSDLTIKDIKNDKEICQTSKTTPSEVVRRANEYLNKKIRELGFQDIPEDIKFIGLNQENKYQYFIPIKLDYF